MTSLFELRSIEEQRMADERTAIRDAALARQAAIEAAERARIEAEEARVRQEHERALAIEQARVQAEREARLRVEAAETAERMRQQQALAEARQAQELELRRAEIAKKRPTWMVVVTGVACIAAAALIWFAFDRQQARNEAELGRQRADARAAEMRREIDEAAANLAEIEGVLAALDQKNKLLFAKLAEADDAAKRRAIKIELDQLAAERRAADKRKADAKEKQDKLDREISGRKVEECLKKGGVGLECVER